MNQALEAALRSDVSNIATYLRHLAHGEGQKKIPGIPGALHSIAESLQKIEQHLARLADKEDD